MEPVDPAVLEGRNPQWRESWEGRLSQSARTRVEEAVKHGRPLEDPQLEPFVRGLLARTRRRYRWMLLLYLAITIEAGFWAYATAVSRPSFLSLFWVPVFAFGLTVVPFRIGSRFRGLASVEQAVLSPQRSDS